MFLIKSVEVSSIEIHDRIVLLDSSVVSRRNIITLKGQRGHPDKGGEADMCHFQEEFLISCKEFYRVSFSPWDGYWIGNIQDGDFPSTVSFSEERSLPDP